MNSLIAIGAGIAALTGIGAGIGIGLATSKATDAIARNGWTRFASATMALGFVCACVGEFLAGINVALLILSFLGFMLSYTAFVFSFPRRNA